MVTQGKMHQTHIDPGEHIVDTIAEETSSTVGSSPFNEKSRQSCHDSQEHDHGILKRRRSHDETAQQNPPHKPRRLSFADETPQQETNEQPPSILRPPRNIDRQISFHEDLSEQNKTMEDEQNHIDRYYDANQYSVTGQNGKDQDSMNRIPQNYQRVLRDRRRFSKDPSVGQSSTTSKKKAVLPIPGANENRFVRSFYWLAHHHQQVGLRHLFMLMVVVTYSLIGGIIFSLSEMPAERADVAAAIGRLEAELNTLSTQLSEKIALNITSLEDTNNVHQYLRDIYIQLQKAENRYYLSAYYKNEKEENMQWTYPAAVFYSINLFMTVGYGTVSPISEFGRFLTIIYAMITIPLSIVVIRDIGQWILVGFTKLYARTLIKWRNARGVETDDDEDIGLPISATVSLMFGYWFFCAFLTWEYDALSGEPGTGMTYWHSLYFSFITLTAIGLGDLMPNNIPSSPIVKIWYFLGLPIIKVVNRITYVALENGIFGTFTVIENKLQRKRDEAKEMEPGEVESNTAASRRMSLAQRRASTYTHQEEEQEQINEFINNFTVRSIATFMRARGDVYAGDFGRVRLSKAQIKDMDE